MVAVTAATWIFIQRTVFLFKLFSFSSNLFRFVLGDFFRSARATCVIPILSKYSINLQAIWWVLVYNAWGGGEWPKKGEGPRATTTTGLLITIENSYFYIVTKRIHAMHSHQISNNKRVNQHLWHQIKLRTIGCQICWCVCVCATDEWLLLSLSLYL